MRRPPSSTLFPYTPLSRPEAALRLLASALDDDPPHLGYLERAPPRLGVGDAAGGARSDRKSTRLNSSHSQISYAVFCLKKKNTHRRHHLLEVTIAGGGRGV